MDRIHVGEKIAVTDEETNLCTNVYISTAFRIF